VTNWFDRISVAEIQVEATELHAGDDILFIGHTTGILEMKIEDLRVDLKPARTAPQGIRCSVGVPLESMPVDLVNRDPEMTPGERIHPRRGDKVYRWVEEK
jgi:putative protease